MPAYFALTFELEKSSTVIKMFYEALIDSGLMFKSGYLNYENDSFEDIMKWNQSELNQNFLLGYTEDFSDEYKQMQFAYADFSEIRVYIMNPYSDPTVDFHLIVPEDDLVEFVEESEGRYKEQRKTEKMEQLKSIAKKVWEITNTLAIQTAWECSDIPPSAREITQGKKPQAEPFCIINNSLQEEYSARTFEQVGQDGILLEDDAEWNYI